MRKIRVELQSIRCLDARVVEAKNVKQADKKAYMTFNGIDRDEADMTKYYCAGCGCELFGDKDYCDCSDDEEEE